MIRHHVFFKVKSTVSKEAIEHAFELLYSLKNKIPGILAITAGQCRFHEGKGKGTITHGFSIDFIDDEAYSTFLNDPITNPAKGCIVNIAVDEHEGIFGFDLGEFSQAMNKEPSKKYRIQAPRLRLSPPGSIYG